MTEDKRSRSPHPWDSDCDGQRKQGRLRASSWDDSDDDSVPETDCKTSRIYSSDEKTSKGSVAEEINELKRQFFKNLEREMKTDSEDAREADRRLSPARVKRRTRSSGSLSPVLERERQISLEQMEKFSGGSETSPKDESPLYLNDFFTELRPRRNTEADSLEDEVSSFDRECIEMYNDLIDLETIDGYFCKTSRKLSRILEVEETRKDSDKSSAENFTSCDLLEKSSKTPRECDVPPFPSPETQSTPEETKSKKEKFRSLSFEFFNNLGLQKPTVGSLSERPARMFCPEIEDEIISLSAKMGKTHLAPSNWQDGWRTAQPNSPMESNRSEKEKTMEKVESMESLELNSVKNSLSENPSPRKRSRESRTSRSMSGSKSKRSWGMESPKFMLNIDGDSVKSLQVEDANEGNSGTFRKSKTEKDSTRRSPKMESPEPVYFTQTNLKEQESRGSLTNTCSSERKKGKQKNASVRISEEKPDSLSESHRRSDRSLKSSRTGKSEYGTSRSYQKSKSPAAAAEDKGRSSVETPKTAERFDLNLPLNIFEDGVPDRSAESTERGKIISETALDSKNSKTERRTSTRNVKSISQRSKDGLENQENSENLRINPLKDPETGSSDASNISSRSSFKEQPSEFSFRSELSNHEWEIESSPTENDKTLQASTKSSRRSGRSQISSSRSVNSRPNSWTPKEKLKSSHENPTSGRTSRSFTPEDERVKETHSKIGDESGRLSSKRLSIINELSFEDLDAGNDSSEKEEERTSHQSADHSKRSSKRNSPKTPRSYKSARKTGKNTSRSSQRSVKEKSSDELEKPDEEKWSELIETFQRSSNSSFNLENNFPGFQDQKEFSWDSIRESVLERKRLTEREEKSEETSLSRRSIGNKEFVKYKSFENIHVEEDFNNLTLGNEEPFLNKLAGNENSQISQSVYYMSPNTGGAFGIGEFGDVTCWNVAEFGTADLEKPKAHGDGVPTHKTSQVLPLGSEMKGSEVKSHRQLRRERYRESKLSSNNLAEDDFAGFIPANVKMSKSDNYISRKTNEGSDCQMSTISSFLNDYCSDAVKSGKSQPQEVKSISKSTIHQIFSSESESEKEDSEFECERISRLCRSLETFQEVTQGDENDAFDAEEPFDNTTKKSKAKKEPADLNQYLARRKKERNKMKSKNWLKTKNKTKSKKKGSGSAKGYLSTGKPRPSVPHLKMRNSNCFQNFYKRFISVFCLTSHSSAATSK